MGLRLTLILAALTAATTVASAGDPTRETLKFPDMKLPTTIDLDPGLKPDTSAVAANSSSTDDRCGLIATQQIDMGRGFKEATPKGCRKGGQANFGTGDFGGRRSNDTPFNRAMGSGR
jgi:hypothetical protein